MGFLAVLTLVFFWPIITPDSTVRRSFVAGDFTDQFFPFHTFAANELAAGRLAQWDPFMYSGYPFQADIQSAVVYPLAFANEWLHRGAFTFLALEWEAVVHFAFAALFTFLLVRLLTRSTAAGLLGAVTFTFGGFLTSYPDQQLPVLESTIWLPLELYCIERAARCLGHAGSGWRSNVPVNGDVQVRPQQAKGGTSPAGLWLAFAGACVALAILAGHPQTVLYLVYLGGAYFLVRMPWRRWWLGLWAVLSACALCAVQLLPSAQLFAFNHKGKLDFNFAAGGLNVGDLVAVVTNNPPGGRILYVGLIPLILALVALVALRSRLAVFWASAAALSMLVGMGIHGPLFRLFFDYLPGWNLFRDQERAVVIFVMSLAVLAGYGLSWLQQALAGRQAVLASMLGGALVLASFANLLVANQNNNLSSDDPEKDFKLGALLAPIKADTDIFRVRVSEDSISHNAGNVLGLQVVSGNSPFELEPFKPWIGDTEPGHAVKEWQVLQLTNSRYVVSSRELCGDRCQDSDGIKQLGVAGKLHLFKILYPQPRAFFVTNAVGVSDERQAIDGINGDFAADQTIFIQGKPAHSQPFDKTAKLRADVVGYSPKLVDLRTSSDRPAYLFTSEVVYPNWQATIDGQPAETLTADGIFRALDVPAGDHHIVFQYVPQPFFVGAAISSFGLVVLAVGSIWIWRRR